jgi:hypothetical protein
MEPQPSPPCSPDLTNFKHSSPCHTEQQRSWPSERTTNNRSTKMLTAVVVDSQMANCNRVGYQQAIPHSPFIASTSGVLVLQARKRKKVFPVAWFNHPKPVQVCQDRYINGLDQEKPVIPTQKAYWTRNCALRSTLQGLLKYESTDF